MSDIERWERIATAFDRDGYPINTRALTGGMPCRKWETEYVRADLHAGAVPPLDEGPLAPLYWKREFEALREAVRGYLNGAPLDERGHFKDPAREVLYRAAMGDRS
jgi:hypothetical protein